MPVPPSTTRSAAEAMRARWREDRESARREARKVADLLVEEFGARRVWLFGSVATGRGFRKSSDIDLAVEGIGGEDFYRAVGRALSMTGFAVDLKRFEDLPPAWRERIQSEGELLA